MHTEGDMETCTDCIFLNNDDETKKDPDVFFLSDDSDEDDAYFLDSDSEDGKLKMCLTRPIAVCIVVEPQQKKPLHISNQKQQ